MKGERLKQIGFRILNKTNEGKPRMFRGSLLLHRFTMRDQSHRLRTKCSSSYQQAFNQVVVGHSLEYHKVSRLSVRLSIGDDATTW